MRDPDSNKTKWISATFALLVAATLAFFGRPILYASWEVEEQIDVFCDGGFPKFNDISKYMIE